MKKMMFALLVVGAVAFAGLRPASAQSSPALVKVPFDFIVGDRVLPAGSYRIAADIQDPSLLQITATQGKAVAAFAATGWAKNPNPMDPQVHVAFKNVDGHLFLWQIAMPGGDAHEVIVTKAEAERTLVKLNLMPAERAEPAK